MDIAVKESIRVCLKYSLSLGFSIWLCAALRCDIRFSILCQLTNFPENLLFTVQCGLFLPLQACFILLGILLSLNLRHHPAFLLFFYFSAASVFQTSCYPGTKTIPGVFFRENGRNGSTHRSSPWALRVLVAICYTFHSSIWEWGWCSCPSAWRNAPAAVPRCNTGKRTERRCSAWWEKDVEDGKDSDHSVDKSQEKALKTAALNYHNFTDYEPRRLPKYALTSCEYSASIISKNSSKR